MEKSGNPLFLGKRWITQLPNHIKTKRPRLFIDSKLHSEELPVLSIKAVSSTPKSEKPEYSVQIAPLYKMFWKMTGYGDTLRVSKDPMLVWVTSSSAVRWFCFLHHSESWLALAMQTPACYSNEKFEAALWTIVMLLLTICGIFTGKDDDLCCGIASDNRDISIFQECTLLQSDSWVLPKALLLLQGVISPEVYVPSWGLRN